jgi:hypothetical protein
MRKRFVVIGIAAVALALGACAPTKKAGSQLRTVTVGCSGAR